MLDFFMIVLIFLCTTAYGVAQAIKWVVKQIYIIVLFFWLKDKIDSGKTGKKP